jgi:hypothetical protein
MKRAACLVLLLAGCGDQALPPAMRSLAGPLSIDVRGATVDSVLQVARPSWIAAAAVPQASLRIVTAPDGARIGPLWAPVAELSMGDSSLLGLALVGDQVPATIEHADDASLDLKVAWPIDLVFAMDVMDPRPPAPIQPLEADVHVNAAGDGYTLTMNARCGGACFRLDGVGVFGDVKLRLAAPATVNLVE